LGEFDLIETYFRWDNFSDNSNDVEAVIIGIGDDAAVLKLGSNQQLVTSIDTLISGVHFPEQTSPAAIAHKALTVNLSDIAAMGAKAKWFTLALTLPGVDHAWLKEFSSSLKNLAEQTSVSLVGGDTTRGPLSISIQVMGTVENNHSLLRSGAKPGDKIFVSGTLGDAAVGLSSVQGSFERDNLNPDNLNTDRLDLDLLELTAQDNAFCEARLNYPTARLDESEVIKHYATSCIDVSDGLLQDLGHILKKSKVSAVIDPQLVPLSNSLQKLPQEKSLQYALHGGDDYELLFTVPNQIHEAFMKAASKKISTKITMIGEVVSYPENNQEGLNVILDSQGKNLRGNGYNHFNDDIRDKSDENDN